VTLLRPRWVAGHLLVLALTGSFIALGFWQLGRDHHKQALVRRAHAAFAAPAPEVTSGTHIAEGDRAQASGHYEVAHQVLLRNQVHGSKDGDDVLTPLVLAVGTAVMVDRGWVPAVGDQLASAAASVAATGPVVIRGIAHTSSPLSAQDAVTRKGSMLSLPRVDLNRISTEVPHRLSPIWIQAQSETPTPLASAPVLPQPPPPDQVNHMEYTIEWFSFALIGIIGWPVALMAFSRRRGGFSTPAKDD
jgi:cytochrome oxidase assembly protein ShyY1